MKTKTNLIRLWAAILALSLAILACGPTGPVTTPTAQPAASNNGSTSNNAPATTRSALIKATVQIYGVHIQSGNIVPYYVGSGSIISSDGLILTNAHVADPTAVGESDKPDALVIGIVQKEDQPPVYSYIAKVRAIDGYVDLAVIQIFSDLKGNSIDTSSLNLPYVGLGNSDDVHVSDHLNILGFPLIGGNTITYTSGDVAGFTAEDQLGDRAWIKTDATISGGNSGGMGTNDQGQLIGVPSIASSGANENTTDCRVIQDTNGDGVIDNKDTCIPIGGFINGLRPINLALPLIQAARSGQAYNSPYNAGGSKPVAQTTGSEQIGPISWFTVDSQGNLGDKVSSYSSGTTVLVAGFKFSGFSNGEQWGEIWTLNGKKVYSNTAQWDQGEQGAYGTSLSNQGDPLQDGKYHLELYAGSGSDPLSQADVTVGNTSAPTPAPSSKGGIIVTGQVTDKASGNGISGAFVVVLNPGVTFDSWSNNGYPKADIFTYAQADSDGYYTLPVHLARNTAYTIVATADGYYDAYGDGLEWGDDKPAAISLDIQLGQ